MVSNVGVDKSNVHEMEWWQEKVHSVTGARKVLQSLLKESLLNIMYNFNLKVFLPKSRLQGCQEAKCKA